MPAGKAGAPPAGSGEAGAGKGPGGGPPGAGAGPGKGGPGGPGGAGGPPAAVEVVKAAMQSLAVSTTAVGSLRSDESVTLRPEVSGRISEILFKEGERVARNSVLVRFDDSVTRAEMEQARANLALARTKFERSRDLEKKGFVSAQARDEADSGLKVSEAAAKLVEARLAKFEVRAPFSGVIGLRTVSVGDYVREGQEMVNLESIDPLKVDFRIPEVFLSQTKVGQPLQFSLDAMPGRNYEGRVFAINPLIDAAGRSIVIRATVRNPEGKLRPGMFARVRLLFDDQKEAVVVPETALVPQGGEQFVFKVVEGRAQRARVDIGQRRDGKVEVLSGVAKDDTIVVAGQLRLREGVNVRIAGAGGPPGKGGPPGEPGKGAPVQAEAKGAAAPDGAATKGAPGKGAPAQTEAKGTAADAGSKGAPAGGAGKGAAADAAAKADQGGTAGSQAGPVRPSGTPAAAPAGPPGKGGA
ncbi:MAG: efflux RND transporter periplasmic adaptor subunit [Burkholderiales bacterium]|nr:efflux RND transporter periplasmic adaptor subunit [Burkholderiales bacterium]